MRKVLFAFMAFALAMGAVLVSAPAASAAMPVLKGSPSGNYKFCTTTSFNRDYRPCLPLPLRDAHCIWNDPRNGSNVAFGFGTGNNSVSTYQGLLLPDWNYCWSPWFDVALPHTVVVGPGYCMWWARWSAYGTIGGPPANWAIFGSINTSGYVVGNKLIGNIFRLSQGWSYSFLQEPC